MLIHLFLFAACLAPAAHGQENRPAAPSPRAPDLDAPQRILQDPVEAARIRQLQDQLAALERDLAILRSWKERGGLAAHLQAALQDRKPTFRVADGGPSDLAPTGRRNAKQLLPEELEKLSATTILLVEQRPIRQDQLDELETYLGSYAREETPLELRRLAMLELLQASVAQASFAQTTAEAGRVVRRISDELDQGKSFEDLAKTYSKGPGAANGGDLGIVGRRTPHGLTIERAIFSTGEGDTTRPFATPFGYGIVRVTEVFPGETPDRERRAARLILVPYNSELEEVGQVHSRVQRGDAVIKYRSNDILPALPAAYR